jgi:hypothetical protein
MAIVLSVSFVGAFIKMLSLSQRSLLKMARIEVGQASSLPALHVFGSPDFLNHAFGKLEAGPTTFSAATNGRAINGFPVSIDRAGYAVGIFLSPAAAVKSR